MAAGSAVSKELVRVLVAVRGASGARFEVLLALTGVACGGARELGVVIRVAYQSRDEVSRDEGGTVGMKEAPYAFV